MVTYAFLLPLVVCVCATATIGAVVRGQPGSIALRGKRDPTRSMLFSGYVPGGGMSAFATSGDYYPYYRARRPVAFPRDRWAPQPAVPEQETKREYPIVPPVKDVPQNTGDVVPQNPQEVNPQEAASEEKPWLTANEKPAEEEAEPSPPAEEQQPPIIPTEDEANIASVEPEESKKAKKKSFTPPKIDIKPPQLDNEEDEDEEEQDDRPNGGNAAASFNAWFPIMLGMFPPSAYGGESGLGYSGYGASGTGSGTRPSSLTSVVANSVSHGRNGVASSHAVAYGGGLPEQPLQARAQAQQQQLQPTPNNG